MCDHDVASPAEQLLAREREWILALQRRDRALLEDVLDDEFTLISWASGGEKLTKSEYIADLEGLEILSCDVRDCITQVYDSSALVRCQLEWRAKVAERLWDASFLITDVWVRRESKWRAVARHASLPTRT